MLPVSHLPDCVINLVSRESRNIPASEMIQEKLDFRFVVIERFFVLLFLYPADAAFLESARWQIADLVNAPGFRL